MLVSAKPTLEFLAPVPDPVQLPRALDAQHPEHDLRGRRVGHLVPHAGRRRQGQRGARVRRARARPAREPVPARGAGRTASARPATSRYAARASGSATCPATRARATEATQRRRRGWAADEAPRNPNAQPRISNFAAGLLRHRARVLRVLARLQGQRRGRTSRAAGGRPPGHRARAALARADRRRRGGQGRRRSSAGAGDTAIVTLALEDDALPIHEDATLKVRPRIFLEGNFFVDLKPGQPRRARSSTRATRSRSRRPPRRCSSTRSCRRSRRTRARTSSCCWPRSARASPTAAPQSLNEAWEPSDEAFTHGRDRCGGGARDERRTTCPSSSTRAGTWPRAGDARAAAARADRGAQPDGARAREPARRALGLAAGARPAARGGRSRARRAQRRLPADARARARGAARRAGGARDAAAGDPGARAGARARRAGELPALLDQLDPAVRSLARLEPDLDRAARRRRRR